MPVESVILNEVSEKTDDPKDDGAPKPDTETSQLNEEIQQKVSSGITVDISSDNEIDFIHHNYETLTDLLKKLSEDYPHLSKLSSLGQSEEGREMWTYEISDNPGYSEPLEPEFKYIANMHGNEVKGREVCIVMIQYLLRNYESNSRFTLDIIY